MINATLILTLFFLSVCLCVGFYTGRGKQNFRSFAVGDKNFSTFSLVATIVATLFGGGFFFRDLSEIYVNGLYYWLYKLCCHLGYFFIAGSMALRMGEFLGDYSIAQSMGKLFGDMVRRVTGFSGVLKCVGSVAIQLTVIQKVIQVYCQVEGSSAAYLAIAIVLLYSVFGGIKAVTITDVIQFITFAMLFPALIYLVSGVGSKLGNWKSICTLCTTHPNFDLRQVVTWSPKLMNTVLLGLSAMIPALQPATVQRIYMAKNTQNVKTSFFYTGVIGTVMEVLMIVLVITLFAQNQTLDPNKLVEYILDLHGYFWIKPMFCIGILALAMSTADSNLHMAGVFFTNDLLQIQANDHRKLNYTRLSMVFTILFAIWLTFYSKDLFKLLIMTLSFYMPIVNTPFLMAILGFRPRGEAVLLAMAGGASVVIAFYGGLGKYFGIISPVFVGMLVNLAILVASHYLLPKKPGSGWVGIKNDTPLRLAQQKKMREKRIWKTWFNNFSLIRYMEQLLPKRTSTFVGMGLYGLFTQWVQIQSHSFSVSCVAMCIAVFLFLYPPLMENKSKQMNRLFICLYPLLFFGLFFVAGAYMMSMRGYKSLSLCIYLMHIALALFLFPTRVVLLMFTSGGILVALITSSQGIPGFWGLLVQNKLAKFYYHLLVFSILYVMILFRKKEVESYLNKILCIDQERVHQQSAKFRTLQYQQHADQLTYKEGYIDMILPDITDSMANLLHQKQLSGPIQQQLIHLIDRLQGYKKFLAQDRYLHTKHIPLNPTDMSLEVILDELLDKHQVLYPNYSILIHYQTDFEVIFCDPIKAQHMLLDGIRWIQAMYPSVELFHLAICSTKILYKLDPEGSKTKSLDAFAFILAMDPSDLSAQDLYHDTLEEEMAPIQVSTEADLYKRECIHLVDAHYGCYDMSSTKLSLVIPQNIHEISDQVAVHLEHHSARSSTQTPSSLAQEQRLLGLLTEQTPLSEKQVKQTISLIKGAHQGQTRHSGEPYYTHPMAVTELLLEESKDPDALLAALLHDVLEDTDISASYLQSQYGSTIVSLVDGVTHLSGTSRKKKLTLAEKHEKLSLAGDLRSLQIKLADRLHNLYTLSCRSKAKQQKVVKQTLDFYIPLAQKIGLDTMIEKLQSACRHISASWE